MKTSDSTIQLRIDKITKQKAQKTLAEIGLDFSSAIKLFLNSVIITESIPFEIRTKNGFTLKREKEILKETKQALKKNKRFSSVKDLMKDLNA